MGSLQSALSWLVVLALGLAPMLVYWVVSIIVLAIGRTTRRRRAERPAGLAAGTGARAKGRSSSRASGEAAEPHSPADSHVALPVVGESARHEPRGDRRHDNSAPLGPGANGGSLTVGVVLSPRSIGQRLSNDE